MLLSLDLTRAFLRDLWLLVPESLDTQSGIRQRLDAARNDKIDYVTNYGAIHDRLADWFTTTFGPNQFDNAMAVAAALEGGTVIGSGISALAEAADACEITPAIPF